MLLTAGNEPRIRMVARFEVFFKFQLEKFIHGRLIPAMPDTFRGFLLEQGRVEPGGVHIRETVKPLFLFLLEDQIVCRGAGVMLVGFEALPCFINVEAVLSDLSDDVFIDRNVVLADDDSRAQLLLVDLVEMVTLDVI